MLPPARNLTTEDVIKKRARGEITCAECKRLKLKCDKKLPCSSCVRRGCPTICPQGSLTPGQRSRFVFTDPELLQQKISEMGQRIRQLEDALALLQSSISSEKHALLRDDLLSIKFLPEIHQAEEIQSSEDALADTMDAFGTLAIGDSGESKYFGRSGGSEILLMVDADPDRESSEKESVPLLMPDLFNRLSAMFPMGIGCATDSQKFEDSINMMFDCLPPTPRAWSLLEAYMENAAWIFQPTKRDHLIEDFLTPIYNAKKERGEPNVKATTQISPHKFAVLFLVLAIGATMDFTLPPNNEEGKRYYHYARAALTHSSIFDSPMMETVQSIVLIYHYQSTSNEPHSQDGSWALIGLGCKLAQNRDPARWNMDEKTANKRRRLFWELHSLDMFLSLRTGRPPSIEPSYVDCAFPQDRTESEAEFWNWKYQFNEVLSPIITLTLAANPPSYKTILELDRKIRENTILLALKGRDADSGVSVTEYLQGSVLSHFRSLTMLYIHKSFFAQALLDHPENVLLSRYAPSFLAISSCASTIIRASVMHLEKVPELCSRWWIMWNNLFSAAIIVGSIVTRAPSSDMAPKAYFELGIAVDLFVKGGGPRVATATLVQLREKASASFHQFYEGSHKAPSPALDTPDNASVDIDELAIFGGQTRVLFKKLLLRAQPNWDGATTAAAAGANELLEQPIPSTESKSTLSVSEHSSSQPSVEQEDMNMQDVHPSLMEYMSMLSSTAHVARPHLLEHPSTSEMPIASQFSAGPPTPDFFHHQPPADYSMQHSQTQTPVADFTYDPMVFGPFEQFYQEAASASGVSSDIWETKGPDSATNGPGGDAIADDRWMGW
ncbi:hypothetical protein FIBSPDRAFT_916075 [Athelia psychrophila]|uniref:Zn(2)-C6 fungal-type domain-containing protein n=1 Tax=Athelia psychrophila TaxID=1759441 RepID=A0A166WCL8_9AGAM|nr:hypothetical protein FIBSPDRAFT_916075 [Fibularhizoctonia sp. CBS 109695]